MDEARERGRMKHTNLYINEQSGASNVVIFVNASPRCEQLGEIE